MLWSSGMLWGSKPAVRFVTSDGEATVNTVTDLLFSAAPQLGHSPPPTQSARASTITPSNSDQTYSVPRAAVPDQSCEATNSCQHPSQSLARSSAAHSFPSNPPSHRATQLGPIPSTAPVNHHSRRSLESFVLHVISRCSKLPSAPLPPLKVLSPCLRPLTCHNQAPASSPPHLTPPARLGACSLPPPRQKCRRAPPSPAPSPSQTSTTKSSVR